MQNDLHLQTSVTGFPPEKKIARPDLTQAITAGATRLLEDMGFAVLDEFVLPNGRRADLAGLGRKGQILIAEVKSCREDYQVDDKWPSYAEYCDYFYFAVSSDFPLDLLPDTEGQIVADRFGGSVLKTSQEIALAAARRKAVTLSFARQAAQRMVRARSI